MQSGIVIGANLVRWPFCQEIAKYKINESSLVNTGQLIGVYMLIGLTRIKIKGLGIKVVFFFYTQTDFKSSKIIRVDG